MIHLSEVQSSDNQWQVQTKTGLSDDSPVIKNIGGKRLY